MTLSTGRNFLHTPGPTNIPDRVSIATYDDHRMAMAFMPLITRTKLEIEDPEVVDKSYPSFWKHCSLLDIQPEFINE